MGKWRWSRTLSPGRRVPTPRDLEVGDGQIQTGMVRFGSPSPGRLGKSYGMETRGVHGV